MSSAEGSGQVLEDAYRSAFSATPSTKPKPKANESDKKATKNSEFAESFSQDAQFAIKSAISMASSIDPSSITAFTGFAETVPIILKGLDALGQIHPFIGLPVMAFKLVVTIDSTRRDNDKKVLAVKLEMQSMVCVLFQLRRMADPQERGPDGTTIADRMQSLMQSIAKDIRECGSACDLYMKKSFLAKTIKSLKYESVLASFAAMFQKHKEELEFSLSIHTALGVDMANKKLDQQAIQLEAIAENMKVLFRQLDTPREKEVRRFIEANGGAEACIDKDNLLNELVKKTGESMSSVSERGNTKQGDELTRAREVLTKEITEDIDVALSRNLELFAGKLNIQNQNFLDAIKRGNAQIIDAFSAGPYQRIQDPDLQSIWKEMEWKGSVKARNFVLALHDYFLDRRLIVTPALHDPSRTPLLSPPTSPSLNTSNEPNQPGETQDWALSYIDVAYLQPILEAIDDDSSTFINIKEINTFAVERPEGWSLTRWIAYWAAGWHVSIVNYKKKIYRIVQEMFGTLDSLLPENRVTMDRYLSSWRFYDLDGLLRSTRPLPDDKINPQLAETIKTYTMSEETRLERNLTSISYNLDTALTVNLVTGPGRIERYIYPLLYLLLKRHLMIFKIACVHIIDVAEIETPIDSLYSIFVLAKERQQHIEAFSKQMYLDVETQLKTVAFGMLSFGNLPYDTSAVSFLTYSADDTEDTEVEGKTESQPPVPLNILKCGLKDTYHFNSEFFPPPKGLPDYLKGSWSGLCIREDGVALGGLFELRFESIDGTNVEGNSLNFDSVANFHGKLEQQENNSALFSIDFINHHHLKCKGTFDVENGTITGKWIDIRDAASRDKTQNLFFCKTPPAFFRYRHYLGASKGTMARARWSFAYAAVQSLVRSRSMSWPAIQEACVERRRYIDLAIRRMLGVSNQGPNKPLSTEEDNEYMSLLSSLEPWTSRLYDDLAMYQYSRMPIHGGIGCDNCYLYVVGPRLACITCREKNLNNGVDFCSACVGHEVTNPVFSHSISHTLLRCDNVLHDASALGTFTEARLASGRIKEEFRNQELAKCESDADPTPGVAVAPLLCAYCETIVTTPCWACLDCLSEATFLVCLDCDAKRPHVLKPGSSHDPKHHRFLYIADSTIVVEVADNDNDPLNEVKKQLTSLQEKLDEHIRSIETKVVSDDFKQAVEQRLSTLEINVEQRLSALETGVGQRLSALEASMDGRFSSMERMLQQLLGLV